MLSLLNFLQTRCWNGYSFALAYLKQVTLAQQQCICGPLSCCYMYPVIPVVIPLTGNSRWRPVPTWRRMFPGYVWQSRTDSWLPREGQRSNVDLKISPYSFLYVTRLFIWNQFSKLQNCSSLENFFVDRPESYSATHSKNCIFIAQKKLRTVWT